MSIDNQPFEEFQEVVDQCIERMFAGETMEQVLGSHPRYSASLEPVLRSASVLLSADPPQAFAVQRARTEARMLNEVAAAPASIKSGGIIMSWFTSFKSRPAVFQAGALAAGVLMFGALGIGGAAAATGNTPDSVRNLFNSSSAFNVEFTGTIASVDGNVLVIEAGGDSRTVTIAEGAEISRDGDDVPASDLTVGSIVEVKGTLQPDITILATRVHLEDELDDAIEDEDEDDQREDEGEDGDDASVTAVPVASATATTPVIVPTIDDDDDCDNSGTGSPCDDDGDVDDDSSGPGSGDDDGANDDNSGPGSGDDDGANDDNSGSGSGDDDAEDDSSGSGSGDDDDDDDVSVAAAG